MEREDQKRYFQRKLNKGKKLLEDIKERNGVYQQFISVANAEVEKAQNTYEYGTKEFGGDSMEAWQAFERHIQQAIANFKLAMAQLHKIAEITPSNIPPEKYEEMSGIINKANDLLLTAWERWGKRMKADEVARVGAMTHWTCASLQAAGIRNADMESKAGEAYCHNECRYRETCDREGL